MNQSALYRHTAILAAPHQRTTPADARMLARLATSVQERAEADGDVLTRREALSRARENLRFVRALAGAVES